MISWGRVMGIGAIVALIAVGCSKREETSGGSQTGSAVDTTRGPGGGAGEPAGGPSEAPSGLAAVHAHEAAIESSIENGRLGEVHHHVEVLQAALERVGREAADLSANQRTVLGQLITDEAAIAEDLIAAGDSGERAPTQKEFARLRLSLRAIEAQLRASAP